MEIFKSPWTDIHLNISTSIISPKWVLSYCNNMSEVTVSFFVFIMKWNKHLLKYHRHLAETYIIEVGVTFN